MALLEQRRYNTQPPEAKEAELAERFRQNASSMVRLLATRSEGINGLNSLNGVISELSQASSFIVSHNPRFVFRGQTHHLFAISAENGSTLGIFYNPENKKNGDDPVEVPNASDRTIYIAALDQEGRIGKDDLVLAMRLEPQGSSGTVISAKIFMIASQYHVLGSIVIPLDSFWKSIEAILKDYTKERDDMRPFMSSLPLGTPTGNVIRRGIPSQRMVPEDRGH